MMKRGREEEDEDQFALNMRQPTIYIPEKADDILAGSLYKKTRYGKVVQVDEILETSMAYTMKLGRNKSLYVGGDAPNIFDLLDWYNNSTESRKKLKDVHSKISYHILNAILELVTPDLIKNLFRRGEINVDDFNDIIKSNTKIAFYLYNYIKNWPIVSTTETTLYSGIGTSFNFRSIQQIVRGKVNDEIIITKFVSMTPQITVAREFARVDRDLHIMKITLGPDCPIVAIPPSHYEFEFLLNMGAIVKITREPCTKKEKDVYGNYNIITYYITVIGFEDYDKDYFDSLIRSANIIWNTDIKILMLRIDKEREEQTARTLRARGERAAPTPTLDIEDKKLSDYESNSVNSDHTQSGGSRKRRKSKKHPSRYNYRKRKSFTKKKTSKPMMGYR